MLCRLSLIPLLTCLSLLLLPAAPAAQAQEKAELRPEWSYHFEEAGWIYYSPRFGVYRTKDGKSFEQIYSGPVDSFEISSDEVVDNAGVTEVEDGGFRALRKPAPRSFVTFFTTPDGIYAIGREDRGVRKLDVAGPALRQDGVIGWVGLKPAKTRGHGSFRGVGIKSHMGKTRASIFAFNEEMEQHSYTADFASPDDIRGFGIRNVTGTDGSEQFRFTVLAGEQTKRVFVEYPDWGKEAAIPFFETSRRRLLYAELGELRHFRGHSVSSAPPEGYPAARKEEAAAGLKSLYGRAAESGGVGVLPVAGELVPALIGEMIEATRYRAVWGVLEYVPPAAEMDEAAGARWFDEMDRVRAQLNGRPMFFLVRFEGQAFAIYHPGGAATKDFGDLLNGCSLFLH